MSNHTTATNNEKWKVLCYQFGIAIIMAIISLIGHTTLVSRAAGTIDFGPAVEAIPGIIIIIVMVMAGLVMKMLIPWSLPAIAYCVLLAGIFTIPGFIPGAEAITIALNKVHFLALATPVTACLGLSAAKDLPYLKQAGLPLFIVTILAIAGSFICSAAIADVILKMTGAI